MFPHSIRCHCCRENYPEKPAIQGVRILQTMSERIGDQVQISTAGPRLIIVCGMPGAGKTTHARELQRRLDAIRFSPDEWLDALALDFYDGARRARIECLQWNLGQELLKLGLTVIIEWGTWEKSEREALRLGAKALGAAVELHYLSAPAEVLFQRIVCRGRENPPIERESVLRWPETFQVPTPEEMGLYDLIYKLEAPSVME